MSDEQEITSADIGPGAGVLAVENPNTDPITVATSTVHVMRARLAEVDPEVERMTAKVARAKADVAAAEEALKAAKASKPDAEAALKAAEADLAAARDADPELAARLDADRDRQVAQRRAELQAELDNLKGN